MVSANPVAVSIDPNYFIFSNFIILIIINFPINLFLYFIFLSLVLIGKDKTWFVNSTSLFVISAILISFYSTVIGAIIDTILLTSISYSFSSWLFVIIIGSLFIFFTFFILSIFIQKLPITSSSIIAGGITIINAICWVFFITTTPSIDIFITMFPLEILILVLSIAFLFAPCYSRQHSIAKYEKIIVEQKKYINKSVIMIVGVVAWLIINIIIFMIFSLMTF
jgi:hypothetical protein